MFVRFNNDPSTDIECTAFSERLDTLTFNLTIDFPLKVSDYEHLIDLQITHISILNKINNEELPVFTTDKYTGFECITYRYDVGRNRNGTSGDLVTIRKN